MKRKKFIQYGTLASASVLANLGLPIFNLTHRAIASVGKQQSYDWVVLYWMPYDNNLSRFGIPILEMIRKGVQSDNVLVAVQSKLSGDKHLSRHIITRGKVDVKALEATDSSSEEVFADYLSWAKSQFKAKKWAIIFLGHGGGLDEISPDENPSPEKNQAVKWMNIQPLSEIITNFNQQVDNRVELLFLQNCNKGTLEASYTFRDAAQYTLSSQLRLGAPNGYYEPTLKFLGYHPKLNGGELAQKIIESEQSNMYHSYTVINNRTLDKLPEVLNPLIDSILSADVQAINTSRLQFYTYMSDQFLDIVEFFQTITQQSGADQQKYQRFMDFLNHSIVQTGKQNGTFFTSKVRKSYQNLSGLGVFFPTNREELDRYRYLNVFSDLKLLPLFEAILFKKPS